MKKLVKSVTNIALTALLLIAIGAVLPTAFAVPVLYIDPALSAFTSDTTSIGDHFMVEVKIANVTDMFAYELKIAFKNATIGALNASRPAGHFLEPQINPGNEFIPVWALKTDLNATHQYWHLGYTRLAPETGEDGSGTLIELWFEILEEPPWKGSVSSPIGFIESKVSNTVPAPVTHTAVPGLFEFSWAAPVTNPYLSVEPPVTTLGGGAPIVGTTFDVTVNVNDLDPNWWVIGAEFKLAYNDTLIDFLSLTNASWVSGFGDIFVVPVIEGTVGSLAYLHTAVILLPHSSPPANWTWPISGSGELLVLTFNVTMQEEFPWEAESPLDLYDVQFSDIEADPVAAAAEEDGLVRILGFITGRNIDLYVCDYPDPYGGQGPNMPSDKFAPQDLVCLCANVTYNLDPVQNKAVDFEVKWPDGTVLLTRTAVTDIYGTARICFRIPWPDQISNESVFGIWDVWALVDIANEVVNDTMKFEVDWKARIVNITVAEEYQKLKPEHGEMWIKVCWEVDAAQELPAIITVVVYDDLDVPIAWGFYAGNFSAYGILDPATFCYNFTLLIPTWAYVGPATVYANIYTDFPQNGGVSYGPEMSATFRIIRPP
jgi:hypothetical protein